MKRIEQYRIFEIIVNAVQSETEVTAVFTQGECEKKIKGFYDGDGKYVIRFMPHTPGVWKFVMLSGEMSETGEFECIPSSGNNHGPVETEGFHFRYVDGTEYHPFGTTCYAWTHQTEEVIEQTLSTLESAPFNKIRMCVFPKSMPYNNNDPDLYPFQKNGQGEWDVLSPDTRFWKAFEENIRKLDDMGIEADLILFHPYDRWGFAKLSREESLVYLEYCIRRLSAFKNIWWSIANEYDLVGTKSYEDWEAFGRKIREEDTYGHLISIHNCFKVYPKTDWMTHCSVQLTQVGKVLLIRNQYQIPVLIDECGYEGNIEFQWGNLSAFEMVHRFWVVVVRGGYCTHGETFFREDEVLWWAKGGILYGESIRRIAFLKGLLAKLPGRLEPATRRENTDVNGVSGNEDNTFAKVLFSLSDEERNAWLTELLPMACGNEDCRLEYIGHCCPAWLDITVPSEGQFRVEVIDVWEMSRTVAFKEISGNVRVPLPAKEGMAVLIVRNQ